MLYGLLLSYYTCRSHTTDKGIASLSRVVRKVEELFLIKLKQLTGECFKGFISRTLKQLSLQESQGVTEAGYVTLIKNCPNIANLCVAEAHKLSDAAFTHTAQILGEKLVSVKCLVLVYCW